MATVVWSGDGEGLSSGTEVMEVVVMEVNISEDEELMAVMLLFFEMVGMERSQGWGAFSLQNEKKGKTILLLEDIQVDSKVLKEEIKN